MWRQQKAIERLEDRLRTAELKIDDLERTRKKLDLEFTELYDKVRHQMSRMAKRYARAEAETADAQGVTLDSSPSDGLDPISRSIMLRRGKLKAEQ